VNAAPGPLFTLSADTVLRSLVRSPRGDRLALVGTRASGGAVQNEIWGRFFALDGTPIGADFPIHAAPTGVAVGPDAAFDFSGDLYVAWTEGGSTLRAIGVAADGSLSGSPVTLASGVFLGDGIRTIRLADPNLHDTGRFMNAWADGPAPARTSRRIARRERRRAATACGCSSARSVTTVPPTTTRRRTPAAPIVVRPAAATP
jgi:hypothetical protein